MCVDGLLALEEFVGVFYRSVMSAEVVDCLQCKYLLHFWFCCAVVCDIFLDREVCAICFAFVKGVCIVLIICTCDGCEY